MRSAFSLMNPPRIFLIECARVVFECGDGGIEQRIAVRIARNRRHRSLVQLEAYPPVDVLLRMVDQHLQCAPLGTPPIAVVDEARVPRHQVVLEMRDFTIERDRLDGAMALQHDRAAGRFVATPRLHSNIAVFDEIEAADAVLAAQPVQFSQDGGRRQCSPVDRDDVPPRIFRDRRTPAYRAPVPGRRSSATCPPRPRPWVLPGAGLRS